MDEPIGPHRRRVGQDPWGLLFAFARIPCSLSLLFIKCLVSFEVAQDLDQIRGQQPVKVEAFSCIEGMYDNTLKNEVS